MKTCITSAQDGRVLLLLIWLSAIVFGMSRLWQYESTPGPTSLAPTQGPVDSPISLSRDHATLIMLVHPHCPCSRASLDELAVTLEQHHSPVTTYVLFYRPKNAPVDWEKTDLYNQAAAIPGVTVISDEDGETARRFHATTSGQALLFDSTGRLLFSGGITAARGHQGDNAGQEALAALLTGHRPKQTRTPVFGCSLLGAG